MKPYCLHRQLAESSPYYEALKKKDDVEVLFCYEGYDELVLMQLQQERDSVCFIATICMIHVSGDKMLPSDVYHSLTHILEKYSKN